MFRIPTPTSWACAIARNGSQDGTNGASNGSNSAANPQRPGPATRTNDRGGGIRRVAGRDDAHSKHPPPERSADALQDKMDFLCGSAMVLLPPQHQVPLALAMVAYKVCASRSPFSRASQVLEPQAWCVQGLQGVMKRGKSRRAGSGAVSPRGAASNEVLLEWRAVTCTLTDAHTGWATAPAQLLMPRSWLLAPQPAVGTLKICLRRRCSKERALLSGVSGSAAPGRLTAIMGPSGSGKTTLLSALAGQMRYSSSIRLQVRGRGVAAVAGTRSGLPGCITPTPLPEPPAGLRVRQRRAPAAGGHGGWLCAAGRPLLPPGKPAAAASTMPRGMRARAPP